MKKCMKCFIPLVMIVAMCFCMTAPAFAATGTVPYVIKNYFPEQSSSNYQSKYTHVLQRYLLLYGYYYDTDIYNALYDYGADGAFGDCTTEAVNLFQKNVLGYPSTSVTGVFNYDCWNWCSNYTYYNYTTTGGYDHFYFGNYVMYSLANTSNSHTVQSGTTWYYYNAQYVTNSGYLTTGMYSFLRSES